MIDSFKAALEAVQDSKQLDEVNAYLTQGIEESKGMGDDEATNVRDTARLLLVARDALNTFIGNMPEKEPVPELLALANNAIDRAFWVSNLEDQAEAD